jgi:hypothetical protein
MGEKIIQNISDEMIMAFVDGELDAGQTKIVEHALAADPALQEKAVMFAETTSMLAGVYDGPLQEEVPGRLLKTVQSYPAGSWWQRTVKKIRRAVWVPVMRPAPAFALMAVLIIGGWLLYSGNFFNPSTGGNYPAFAKGDAFSQGLEGTPSGKSFIDKQFAVEIVPVLTFRDREYSFCRRFEALSKTDSNHFLGSGIACRGRKGHWQTIAYVPVRPKSRQQQPDGRSYELAGARDPIDAIIDKRRQGQLLGTNQELELIRSGWSRHN